MAHSFSLGIRQIWEELSVMQAPGFIGSISTGKATPRCCVARVIAAQPATHKVALICSGDKPDRLLAELASPALEAAAVSITGEKAALTQLSDDLMRALRPQNRLLILLAHASL